MASISSSKASQEEQKEKLSKYTMPAVVRIINQCFAIYDQDGFYQEFDLSFLGTGFIINPNGYIATSANIIGEGECKERLASNMASKIVDKYYYRYDFKNEQERKKKKEEWKKKLLNWMVDEDSKQKRYSHNQLVFLPNPNIDPLPFESKESGRDKFKFSKTYRDVGIIKIPITNAPTLKLEDSDQVEIQDPVLMVGYPVTADFNYNIYTEEKLTQESYYEASVQEGKISSTSKQLDGGYPVIQVDIQTGDGNGGSPILNEKGRVVGLLASKKHSSSQNNTIPLAVPISTINEFINASGTINNHQGATDKLYREGLDLFYQGNYQGAKKNFLRVKRLFKVKGVTAHAEVEELIDEIEQIETGWWENPLTNPTNLLLITLLVGGGIVGTVAFFLLKQRPQFAGAIAGDREGSTNADSAYNPSYKRNGKGKKCFMEMEYKGQIQRFQLGRSELRLGRDPAWSDLDIPTSWEVISRRHGILKKEGDDYRIFDGDRQTPSRNGLWVNDDFRVDSQDGYLLHNGDRLKIGQDKNDQVLITYFNPNRQDDGGSAHPKTTMAN